jgi:glyoxylase I family protein
MRIEHIGINVPRASDHAQWYVQHLGMRIVRKMDTIQIHFIADENGQVMLELFTNPDAPIPDYPSMNPSVFHIAFSVDDIAAERERLLAVGASSAGDINTTPAGDQLVFLRDPWGVCLQLAHRQNPML